MHCEGQEEASRLGTRPTRMRITHAWDRDAEAAQAFARPYGAQVVKNFADMVGAVDGIILDDFDSAAHFTQLARPYLEAGTPIFVNRPLALSMAAANELIDLARKHQTPVMSGSTFEFAPETEAVRQRVEALEEVRGYVAANSMSDYATHGIHGLWFVHACMGGDIRSVAYQTPDWRAPNGLVTLEHEGRHGGRPFYGSVQQISGTWAWIRVFGDTSFEQSVGTGAYFWLPLLLEMQRMFETRRMPQSYETLLEKTRLFLAGFRSHLERGGAPVRLDDLDDWHAPLLNPDPYPSGYFT
jgi:predicted dehydrogenase